jgi:competence protein ComEC
MAAAALGVLCTMVGRRNTGAEAARRLGWMVAPVPLVTLGLGLLARPHDGPGLTLHFLDVGQGDAAVIETPNHRWVLIDAGPAGPNRDAGRQVVVPFLARHGVARLDLAILSHAHLDHYGGSAAVLRSVRTDLMAEPAEVVADPGYLGWLDRLDGAETPWRPLRAGTRFEIDGVGFEVLHPDSLWSGWGRDLNDDSVVLRIQWGRFDAVFPGDAGFAAESALAGRVGAVDLLKVGHHGSRTSSGAAWLAELRPTVAVVSTGPNRYGHPTAEALGRLAAAGADLWRTDRDGEVTVAVSDSTIRVTGRHGSRSHPLH